MHVSFTQQQKEKQPPASFPTQERKQKTKENETETKQRTNKKQTKPNKKHKQTTKTIETSYRSDKKKIIIDIFLFIHM